MQGFDSFMTWRMFEDSTSAVVEITSDKLIKDFALSLPIHTYICRQLDNDTYLFVFCTRGECPAVWNATT